MSPAYVHATAEVHPEAQVGDGTKIWRLCHVREDTKIGRNCILGMGVYVDEHVTIGDNCKIQNYVALYHGVALGNDVFVGPHACFTNDMIPRATDGRGNIKRAFDIVDTAVADGASIGANSTIVCGHKIGKYALVAAGSVVTKDVPDHALVMGNPARVKAYVCRCGSTKAGTFAELIELGCDCMKGVD